MTAPTKKPIGSGTDRNGRRARLYDTPSTPLDRLLAAKVLSAEQETERIAYLADFPTALPDIGKSIRAKAAG